MNAAEYDLPPERPMFAVEDGLPVELSVCPECKALVAGASAHAEWHVKARRMLRSIQDYE